MFGGAPHVSYDERGQLVVVFAPEHEAVIASRDTLARMALLDRVDEQLPGAQADALCKAAVAA